MNRVRSRILPFRLITSDIRRALSVVALILIALVALRIASGLSHFYTDELGRAASLWSGEIEVSETGVPFDTDQLNAVNEVAEELNLRAYPRAAGAAWAREDGLLRLTGFVAVRPDDPILAAGTVTERTPVEINQLFVVPVSYTHLTLPTN